MGQSFGLSLGHTDYVFSVSLSPDGTRIMPGFSNTTNISDCEMQRRGSRLVSWVYSVSFSLDNAVCRAVGCNDEVVVTAVRLVVVRWGDLITGSSSCSG
jgi:WD40 repeat protein